MYPILGGYSFKKPAPIKAPLSPFNEALCNTPLSSNYKRVIPFDYSTDKFVFGAVDDKIFKQRYDRKALRSKMLKEFANFKHNLNFGSSELTGPESQNASEGNPSKCYNLCFLILLIFIGVLVLAFVALLLIFWASFQANWYWWVLVFFVLLLVGFAVCLIIRWLHIKETL